jgi:hypothetical protein
MYHVNTELFNFYIDIIFKITSKEFWSLRNIALYSWLFVLSYIGAQVFYYYIIPYKLLAFSCILLVSTLIELYNFIFDDTWGVCERIRNITFSAIGILFGLSGF